MLQLAFDHVVTHLKLSKIKMQKQYNRNLRFNDYKGGDKVWLKVKYYKTGENRKLSRRRSGPWTVLTKLPNGVNFKIRNDKSNDEKVVHHDRMSPFTLHSTALQEPVTNIPPHECEASSSTSSDSASDYEPTTDDSSEEAGAEALAEPRYSRRALAPRLVPGMVSWDNVNEDEL